MMAFADDRNPFFASRLQNRRLAWLSSSQKRGVRGTWAVDHEYFGVEGPGQARYPRCGLGREWSLAQQCPSPISSASGYLAALSFWGEIVLITSASAWRLKIPTRELLAAARLRTRARGFPITAVSRGFAHERTRTESLVSGVRRGVCLFG